MIELISLAECDRLDAEYFAVLDQEDALAESEARRVAGCEPWCVLAHPHAGSACHDEWI